ncbi:hypothetical protein EEL31_02640 [Brevibacillus laterosporus]|uniref:Alkyl hydroperoxide reductase subunit C/ Thiol specific antioxidant domain-containing protein n=1 Tax=Brevibacillus laterosporus TaxID=1465 RepID=A0A518V968_BRELA|nr:hypothetical protein EEL30_15295 [Brevibacillus laterosporus]TPG73284.1 hypothetical protein EEL31_02640 [Brevibacillus laterosporus]
MPPILLDVTKEVAKRYQAISIPTSYFIDEQGMIRQKVIGPKHYWIKSLRRDRRGQQIIFFVP